MALPGRNPKPPSDPTSTGESAFDPDDLVCDGRWVGPRSLRVFVLANRVFVAVWAFVLTSISIAVWAHSGLSWLFRLPLAIATGAAVTTCLLFAFSRGWIAEGD